MQQCVVHHFRRPVAKTEDHQTSAIFDQPTKVKGT